MLANQEGDQVKGDIEAVQAALAAGADINERNTTFNDTPLLRAATLGQWDTLRLLLERGADVHAEGGDAWTALHWAARNAHTGEEADVVVGLLEEGAKVGARSKSGYTPLHVAASHGNLATVMTLVEYGADVHATDEEGQTPLIVAAYRGHAACVDALLDAGASTAAR